ncbi:unnamed protein product, partial [Cylindrotheca closterium]
SPDRQAVNPPVRSSNRTLGKSSTGKSSIVPNTVTKPKKAIKQGKTKQPAKKARTSAGVQFQEPSSAQPSTASAVQVDTSHMEGDNTTAASQDESQTSSLTASTPRGGGSPFFSPPTGKAHSDGATRDWSGDDRRRHSSLSTRVCFQNVNGLPENGTDSKQQQINSWLKEEQVGIALLAEAKTFWPSINEGHGWSDRLRQATMKSEQKGFYSSVAYNRHQDRSAATSAVQWGGCIATVLNQVAHRAKEAGRDPTGLGQWAYVRLQGRKLKAHGGNVQDSLVEITKWRDEGCEVVLGIDANEDVTVNVPQSIRHRFRACGLEEAILKHHPPQATHQHNQRNIPIDGIFTTLGVQILAGGYYAFDEFFDCDHRGLWIDIDLSASLGNFQPPKSNFKPRKLSLQDSRSVRKYLQLAHKGYAKYSIPERLNKLNKRIAHLGHQMTPPLVRKYNCLHRRMYTVRRQAEEKCRALAPGKVPWSPKMQGFWDRMSLWKLLLKGKKGCRVSSRKVRRLMKKTALPQAWRKSEGDLEDCLKQERALYGP